VLRENPTNPTIGIEVVDCMREVNVGLVLASGTFPTRKPDIGRQWPHVNLTPDNILEALVTR
jgi:hypothetical protein